MRVSYKLVVLVVCALAGMVTSQGCQKETKMAVKGVPAVEPNLARLAGRAVKPAVESNDIAVTVNGSDIPEADVEVRIKPDLDRIAGMIDQNTAEQSKKRIRAQAIDWMITEWLLDEQVKQAGIIVTDNEVNDKISEIATQQRISVEGFKNRIEAHGGSFEQVTQQIKKGLGYEKLVEHHPGAADVNDAEALEYYAENLEDYNTPEQVQASHILIKPDPDITDPNEAKAKAIAKAKGFLKQIKAGGDFAALARANSDCQSRARGGDIGLLEHGSMLEDAVFGMQVGQVSDLVETQEGYHIIKVTDRKPAGLTPFEKAKPDIVKMLEQMKKGRWFRQYIEKLKAEAKIVYPPGKEPMLDRPLGPAQR